MGAGEVGEFVVTGEHVCREYFRSPAATAEVHHPGPDGRVWHRMGDTGWIDREGRFWLVGRVHSTIVRDGRHVHPQLVEQAATAAAPGLVRAAAVGMPDAVLGERVVLVLAGSRMGDRQTRPPGAAGGRGRRLAGGPGGAPASRPPGRPAPQQQGRLRGAAPAARTGGAAVSTAPAPAGELTPASPFLRRFRAYLAQRFPSGGTGP